MGMASAWVVLVSAASIVTISMGIRQSFGLFLQPISLDLETGRQVFALAIAIQNLMFGLAQPFVGLLADRYGARLVCIFGALLYALGLAMTQLSADPLGLYVTMGGLIGLALSGTTYVVVLGAVARVVPPHRRSAAFGLTTAAGSFGMFAVVPGTQAVLEQVGWQETLLWLALAATVICLLALGLAGARRQPNTMSHASARDIVSESGGNHPPNAVTALRQAAGHRGYWLLTTGFFVCGFHVAFIATHLPSYLNDRHVDALIGALSLALIGFFNIIGSYLFGALGDIISKKYLLSGLYAGRAAVMLLFLAVPVTGSSALVFSAVIGFLWLGTVPLTSGLVAHLFGSRYLSTLYGFVFLSHQLGSFLGAWLGGYVYDLTGSYDIVWLASVALGLIAAALHAPIPETPRAEAGVTERHSGRPQLGRTSVRPAAPCCAGTPSKWEEAK